MTFFAIVVQQSQVVPHDVFLKLGTRDGVFLFSGSCVALALSKLYLQLGLQFFSCAPGRSRRFLMAGALSTPTSNGV